LLGVLMGDEELPAPIDQHRMQLRAEIAARRQSEIPAQLIEKGVERPGPAPLVDLHAAQGNFLRVTDFAVQKRLLAPPELGRAAQQVQVLGLGLGPWQAQRSHPPHLKAEIIGWRGPLGAEGTSDGDLCEADGQPVACRDRHGAHSSVRYLPGAARLCRPLEVLIVRSRTKTRLESKVLALGHQLRMLARQGWRPRWQPALSCCPSRDQPRPARGLLGRSLLTSPDTLRWPCELTHEPTTITQE